MKRILLLLAALTLLLGGVGQARADYIATVTVDTTALTNNPSQGPFTVGFSLRDFDRDPNNNTATISNFKLTGTGASLTGTATLGGSPSGDLSSTLTLKDSPQDTFAQQFIPGSTTPSSLSFTLDLTTNYNPNPIDLVDTFIFSVSSNGAGGTVSELIINISGPNPALTNSGGSVGSDSVPAPVVTPVVSTGVPEPSTLTLLSLGSLSLVGYGWRRRNRAAA
jgi:hypothetical protein